MAIYLEDRLNALNYNTQLPELSRLLDDVQTDFTFWGTRVVHANGNKEDNFALEKIASRVLDAAVTCKIADNLTPVERVAGLNIVMKLNRLYLQSDAQIRTKGCFTKFLRWLCEYDGFYSPRSKISTEAGNLFCSFTVSRFNHLFGLLPFGVAIDQHPAYHEITVDQEVVYGRRYFRRAFHRLPHYQRRQEYINQLYTHPSLRIIAKENSVRNLVPA